MAEARNYYRWLHLRFRAELHGSVIEHGSGTGLLSATLISGGVAPLVLTEPDPALAAGLRERFPSGSGVEIFEGTLERYAAERGGNAADAVISANVLEHVPDDAATLAAMHAVLKPGGALCLYVPARPELFGSLDRAFHHHRRYRRGELRDKLAAAGFKIERLDYRNLANAPLWWWMGRVLRTERLALSRVRFYDRWLFPALSRLENLLPPPYGSNLLALARKSTG